jgi:hypothetical protein
MYGLGTPRPFSSDSKLYDVHWYVIATEDEILSRRPFDRDFQRSEFQIQTPEPRDSPNFPFTHGQNFKFETLNHMTAPNIPFISKLPRPSLPYYPSACRHGGLQLLHSCQSVVTGACYTRHNLTMKFEFRVTSTLSRQNEIQQPRNIHQTNY